MRTANKEMTSAQREQHYLINTVYSFIVSMALCTLGSIAQIRTKAEIFCAKLQQQKLTDKIRSKINENLTIEETRGKVKKKHSKL